MSNRITLPIFFLLIIATLVSVLYIPFLSNSLVFDDHGLFTSLAIYDAAQTPLKLQPRAFPYFTLGFIQVLSGSIEANRIFSLCLHFACSCALFFLLRALLQQARKTSDLYTPDLEQYSIQIQILAALGTLFFTIHPIAVYGAAYLAQRTILFATLFSLFSLWFYRRSFAENRTVDVATAALFYAMAVFSKEHAIMLPLVALPLTLLYEGSFRSHFKRISLYLALCLPAAFIVLLATKHIVASSYEPDVGVMLAQMHEVSILDRPWGKWLVSILMQTGFFFDYILYWIAPDVRFLSADMRFDFVDIWFSWGTFLKAFIFFLSPILAIYFLRKKGFIALFCCGFLYCWLLFLTELAAVRFQEPFVLYRSYLWAPGYLMMLVALCGRLPTRWLIIAAMPMLVVCFLLARDRLNSFSDEGSVWKDAARKLSSSTIIGSERIFYNRGNAYLTEKKYAEAIADYSLAIQQNPKFSQAYYNRGLAFSSLHKHADALADIEHAILLNNKDGAMIYTKGFILEEQGCFAAARRAYTASNALGNWMAKLKLEDLKKSTSTSKELKRDLKMKVCAD